MSGALATAAIVGGIGAAGSIGGAALGSSAAKSAANTQANAANQAAQLQYQASQNALDFQKQQYAQNQANLAPWLQMGGGALGQLGYLMGITPNTSIGQPVNFGNAQIPQTPSANPLSPSGGSLAGSGAPSMTGSPLGAPRPTSMLSGPTSGIAANPVSPIGSPVLSGAPAGSTLGIDQPISSIGSAALQTSGVPSANPVGASGVQPIGAPALPNGSPSAAGGFGSLLTPYSGHFEAPTNLTEQNDPGYQARLNLGTDALQRSAAARGNLLTGGTAKALDTYAQDYASNEYNNVYNRALTGFQTNYNQYNNDQNNIFNRLAAISGVGQTTAGQLASLGNQASNNVSNNLLSTAGMMGQQYNNAAAANASGIVGSANAWGGALNGIGGNLSNLYMLNQMGLLNGGGYSGPGSGAAGMGF